MHLLKHITLFITVFISLTLCDINNNEVNDECELPESVIKEIHSYQRVVDDIINKVVHGRFKGSTFNYLETFIDKFGSRMAGTENLENAIDYMLAKSKDLNLDRVYGEEVQVPHWVRGNESASMLHPRYKNLAMLGLGSSVGTPIEGIQAEAVVVSSFDELDSISTQVKGKIVVFNQEYISYGQSVQYRSHSSDKVSAYGGIATLIRSVTPFSLNTPHTGWQDYSGKVAKIPAACITVEDANMLHRMYKKNEKIIIEIRMDAENLPAKVSRNTITEINGASKPEEVVLVSGHLDSWDVGDGAMDDGAGAFIGWNALVVLKAMGLRPRRTLRSILWTGEEVGLVGAIAYEERHRNESKNLNFVMESDEGTFTPLGLTYAGTNYGACVVQEILKMFSSINATKLVVSKDVGSDIIVFISQGIPGASLMNKNEKYFWYHHTEADTMDIEDSDTLDTCTALWASVAYIIADLSFNMPRNTTSD